MSSWEEIRDKIDKNTLLRQNVRDISKQRPAYALFLHKAAMIAAFIILPFTAGLILSPSVARFVFSPESEDSAKPRKSAPSFVDNDSVNHSGNKASVVDLSRSADDRPLVPHGPSKRLSGDDPTRRRISPRGRENVALVGTEQGSRMTESLLQDIFTVPPRGGITIRTEKLSSFPAQGQTNAPVQSANRRPWIGVTLSDLTDDRSPWRDLYDDLGSRLGVTDGRGAVVMEIVKNSPAHEFGIRLLDVIVGLDGKRMDNKDQIGNYVSKKKVGNIVTLDILRNKNPFNIKVRLGQKPELYIVNPRPREEIKER